MGHDHAPSGAAGTLSGTFRSRLLWTIGISASITVIQVVGALLSGSLALLADAAHSLTDAVGVALALGAITLAQRAPTPRRTFGFYRVEIFSAVLNALLLVAIFVWVLWSAIGRFSEPVEVKGGLMFAVAVGGLAANLVGLWLLRDAKDRSLNLRGAYLEVLGDALGSVAVIVGGLVILLTGWQAADPIASIVIGLLIVPRAYGLLRDALHVLMEAAPQDMDLAEVRRRPPGGARRAGGPRSARLDRHLRNAGPHGPRGGLRRRAGRRVRGPPRAPPAMRRRPLRRGPFHDPAGARGTPRDARCTAQLVRCLLSHRGSGTPLSHPGPARRPRDMDIAIAGGTGTLGSRVAEELRTRGHRVRVLSRRSPEYPVDLTTGRG